MTGPRILSQSSIEPITLEFARRHLKLIPEGSPLSHPDDDLVMQYITVAREHVENYTGVTLVPAVLEQVLDAFPTATGGYILPGGPVRGIVSLTYLDGTYAEQTLDSSLYRLSNVPLYPVLSFVTGASLPSPAAAPDAVRIRYNAGHTDNESPNDLPSPASLRHAILLMLTHWYENRSSVEFAGAQEIPFSATALMNMYRARRGVS